MKLHLKEGAKPSADFIPAKVPIHWKDGVRELLQTNVDLGVIKKVPEGVPTKWCSRMVVQPKKSGKLRMTVDLTKVNDLTYRELHHQITPHDLVCDIPRDQVKMIVDCWNGYHSVNLPNSSRIPRKQRQVHPQNG